MGGPSMAGRALAAVIIAACLCTIACQSEGGTVSLVKSLLPFGGGDRTVSHVLSDPDNAEHKFKWSGTHPKHVSVTPNCDSSDGCCTSATVTAIATRGERRHVRVTAQSCTSTRTLRGDVFVDSVKELKIFHRTHKVEIGDVALLRVLGFDSRNNDFTSMHGLEFEWSVDSASRLALLPNHESGVQPARGQDDGMRGDSIWVKGLDVGYANITVKISGTGFTDVPPATYRFSVVEALEMKPRLPTFLAPHCDLQYGLVVLRGNVREEVELPSANHKWKSVHDEVGTIDPDYGLFSALQLGDTEVVATDTRIDDNDARAVVRVVHPHKLVFDIAGAPKHTLISGEEYRIGVVVHDDEGNEMTLTDDMEFEFDIEQNDQYLVKKGSNRHSITAVANGHDVSCTISVSLLHIKNTRTGAVHPCESMTISTTVKIYDRVRILDEAPVVLPLGQGVPAHAFHLQITGGSSRYVWGSNNPSHVSVNSGGVVVGRELGEATVYAYDFMNENNRAEIKVIVDTPASLRVRPGPLEVAVGNSIVVEAIMVGERGLEFSNCTGTPVEWYSENSALFDLRKDPRPAVNQPPSSCSAREVVGRQKGSTPVHAGVSGQSKPSMHATTAIAVYDRLQVVVASSQEFTDQVTSTLLAPGSTAILAVKGGPEPWQGNDKSHVVRYVADDQGDSSAFDVSLETFEGSSDRTWRVHCLRPGTVQLSVEIFNEKSISLPYPAVATHVLTTECAVPSALLLQPRDLESKLEGAIIKSYRVRTSRSLQVLAVLVDRANRPFNWVDSTLIRGALSNTDLASLDHEEVRRTLVSTGHQSFFDVTIGPTSGYSTLNGNFEGCARYSGSVPQISTDLELIIRPNVVLVPQTAVIFNHPNNRFLVTADGGSGSLKFSVEDSTIVSHSVLDPNNGTVVHLTPLRVGSTRLVVTDVALSKSIPDYADIAVSDVAHVDLRGVVKVPLGSSVVTDIVISDSEGRVFPASQHTHMKRRVMALDDRITITNHTAADVPAATAALRVRGTKLGVGRLNVVVENRNGHQIQSSTISYEVFPPLAVHPSRLRLVPGVEYQLDVSGGPKSDTSLSYEITSEDGTNYIEVDEDGTVFAKSPGHAVITVSSYTIDEVTHETIVFASAAVAVTVDVLDAVDIVGSTHLHVGESIPLHVLGSRGETPFTFGTSGMTYTWAHSNGEAAELIVNDYARCTRRGAAVSSADRPSTTTLPGSGLGYQARLLGRHPGQTTVHVKVVATPLGMPKAEFDAFITVTVTEGLRVVDIPSSPPVILAPASSVPIVTNKHLDARPFYTVMGVPSSQHSQSGPHSSGVISVDETGRVYAQNVTGVGAVHISDALEHYSVVVPVLVKRPVSMFLSPKTLPCPELPVGGSVEFALVMVDEYGNRFSSLDDVPLRVETNSRRISYSQSAHSNATLVLSGLRAGTTTIRVSLHSDPAVQGFMTVKTRNVIQPSSPMVHLGGTVQFATGIRSHDDDSGDVSWRSDDSSVLTIDRRSGTARAVGVGTANVHYSGAYETQTTVTVVKVATVTVSPGRYVGSGGDDLAFRVPLTIMDQHGSVLVRPSRSQREGRPSSEHPSLVDHGITFSCNATHSLIESSTELVDETGHYCLFTPSQGDSVAASLHHAGSGVADAVPVPMTVSISDRDGSYTSTAIVDFEYVPPFHIIPEGELRLSEGEDTGTVEVRGGLTAPPAGASDDIQGRSSDQTLISVVPAPTRGTHEDASARLFTIKIQRPRKTVNATISFVSSRTGQRETLTVYYVPPPGSDSLFENQAIAVVVLIAIGAFGALILRAGSGPQPAPPSTPRPAQAPGVPATAPHGGRSPGGYVPTATEPRLRNRGLRDSSPEPNRRGMTNAPPWTPGLTTTQPLAHNRNSPFVRRR